MARLLLLRHAKSSRDDPALADYDRPLAPRGERDAGQIGKLLAARGLLPDRILCSGARRTRQTLVGVLPHLPGRPKTEFRDDLYNAAGADYLDVIAAHGGAAATLLVIGHNPMIQDAALRLIGNSDSDLCRDIAAKYPTAAVAVIDFDMGGWSEIAPGGGQLVAVLRPGDH